MALALDVSGGRKLVLRAQKEALEARQEIRDGYFQRSMAAVTGLSAVASGFEAYVQHRRGAFSHWLMWTPVVLTPPTAAVAGAALVSERVARKVLPVLSVVTLVDGVLGFAYHIRGIQRMPGGFKLGRYNIVMGPPVFAPLLMCTVGVAGVLAGFLRREGHGPALGGRGKVGEFSAGAGARLGGLWQWMADSARGGGKGVLKGKVRSRGLPQRIAHGRFQQLMAGTAAGFAVLAGGEAYFEHLRGSFENWVMWTPVILTPPMVAAGVGAVLSERVARTVLPAASAAVFADGLVGFALHVRGIQRMPGGLKNLEFNVTMGPPAFAPLLLCAVGLMGMVASLLRRKGN